MTHYISLDFPPPNPPQKKQTQVGEFDTPANLVANQRSLLMGFIRQTGPGSSRRLVGIANNANGNVSSDDNDDNDSADNNDVSNRTASTVTSASASNNGNETDSASPPSSPDTPTAVAAAAAAGASEEQAAVPAVAATAAPAAAAAAAAGGAGGAELGDQAARELSQVVVAADVGQPSGTATPPAVARASPRTSPSPKPTE